jgi:SP family myo-inositol transporter-like MFS transporter 13
MGVAMVPRQLIEGRAIMGVAIGLASIVGPVYIAESAPNSIRAMMVVMYAIEIGVGTSLAYILDFGFAHTTLSWRLMLSVAAVPAALQMIAMFHLPESPRWLAHFGRVAEAKETMARLTIDPDDVETDAEELDNVYARGQYLRTEEGQAESWNVRSREVVTQLCLGVGLFLTNNFSGECALVYYSIEIIGMAGFASEDAIAQAIVNIGACATAGVLIGFFLIDRMGRRKLVCISGAGTCVSLFLLAASFAFANTRSPAVVPAHGEALSEACTSGGVIDSCADCLNLACSFCGLPYTGPGLPTPGMCLTREGLPDAARDACTAMPVPGNSTATYTLYHQGCPSGYGWLSLLALCSFQFWFQLGLGIVPAAVNAEYYPNSVRGLCNGSAVALSWLGNFCVSSTFLSLSAALGVPRLFCINATIVGTGTLLALFFLPETCGLSFVEIQALFKLYGKPGSPPPWALWDHIIAQREVEGTSMSPSPRGGTGEAEAGGVAAVFRPAI